MKNIACALLNAQKLIKNASKDAKNPHYRNDYATLESVMEAVKKPANAAGLLIVQGHGRDEMGDYVNTTVFHAESGENISSKIYLVLDKQNMQGVGSAITYARRYSLASLFFVCQTDDDGNAASIPVNSWAMKNMKPTDEESGQPSTVYRVPFGKFVKKSLDEIDIKEMMNYIEYLEDKARKDNKEIKGVVKEFIDKASSHIAALENGELKG
jgi:ERF superfamily protein